MAYPHYILFEYFKKKVINSYRFGKSRDMYAFIEIRLKENPKLEFSKMLVK